MRKDVNSKKPERRGKGKPKPNYRSNSEASSNATSRDEELKHDFNDLSWYVVDQQMLNDVARIPYSIPVGMPISRNARFQHTPTGFELRESVYDSAIPGILVSHVMPILGIAKNADDPLNVAANSIYQFVRSKISGSRPYDAVDFMIYLGAMDSIFSYCTWLTRAYATAYTYHQANRYLARAILEAQYIDYDDFISNLPQFRAGFNARIAKIKALFVPSNMSLFVRHSWMFSNYYIEGQSEKDQIYLHMPAGFYHFKYDSDGAGMLEGYNLSGATNDGANPITVQQMFNLLDSLLAPVYADEDFNKISGDLLKAYEGKVFTISEIPDIATISLIYNEEVLLQFKNAKYLQVFSNGDRWAYDFFDYHQDTTKTFLQIVGDTRALECESAIEPNGNNVYKVDAGHTDSEKTVFASKMADWSKNKLLTSPHNDVVPGENMINTRLIPTLEINGDASSYWSGKIDDISAGTEWPVFYSVYAFRRSKSTGTISLFHRIYELSMHTNSTVYGQLRTLTESQLPVLSSFKYHPELFITVIEVDPDTSTVYFRNAGRSIFEVDNYALVDHEVIKGLHTAAILGQYNVPGLSIGR